VKVLIVDDNAQNLYMLQALLEGNGYQVEMAANGVEALEKARHDPPALIVSDILMPVMDGFTLCRKWQQDEWLKEIPFIFYTATYTDPRDEAFALSLGAERFVVKPTEPDVFVGILQQVISEAEEGHLRAPGKLLEEDLVYFKTYNERLVRKLEDKMLQLERANRRLAALYRASAALSSLLPPEELVLQTLHAVVEAMAFVNAIYFAYDEERQAFHLREAIGFPAQVLEDLQRRLVFHLGEERGLVGLVGQARQPLVVADTKHDPRWTVFDGTVHSALFVPVVYQDRLLGVVSFLSTIVDDFDDADVRNATILTNHLSIAIQNARLVKDLRQSEARFRRLAENAQDVIYRYRSAPHPGFEYVSPAVTAITGYTPEECYADPDLGLKLVHPDNRPLLEAYSRGEGAFEEPLVLRWVRKDGRTIWIEQRNVPIYDEAGNLVALEGIARDVTRRKQAEETLRQHAKRLETLHEIDQAILTARSPEDIAQAALGRIRQLVTCLGAGVVRFDTQTQEAILFAVHGEDVLALKAGTRLPLKGLVEIETLRQGQALVEGDVTTVPDPPPVIQVLQAADIRSYAAVPLTAQGTLIGALALGSASPNAFPPEYVEITREVADQVAVALHQADLRAALEVERQRLEALVEHLPQGILLLDGQRRVLLSNPVARDYLPVLAKTTSDGVLVNLAGHPAAGVLTSPTESVWRELEITGPPHRVFEAAVQPVGEELEGGDWVLVVRDVTGEREVQARIQQQERLAAVGQLAGGIAHDFNNLLTTIILYAQMPLDKPDLPPDAAQAFKTILGESRKATTLVQQVLDFSRRSPIEVKAVDLTPFVKEAVRMLERTIPESISLLLEVEAGEHAAPLTVNADPTRIQQVLMNLVVNARDAMPEGGVLRIGLSGLKVEPGKKPPVAEMEPGRWVCLAVSDTGTGIPPHVLPHIFEPFFTTKPRGEGTGLGLAQVHGIVQQHGGHADVETELGRGTTFRVYLPAYRPDEQEAEREEAARAMPEGRGETILLVEDNEKVRRAGQMTLQSLNYRVLTARNGQDALEVCRSAGKVDLVLTDVVMPEMGGVKLTQELRKMDPGLRILVLTGYLMAEDMEQLAGQDIQGIVYKPLDAQALAQKIRKALDTD
jgi:two-component system cell cycle sensor histidine kinase/response regulator CckA